MTDQVVELDTLGRLMAAVYGALKEADGFGYHDTDADRAFLDGVGVAFGARCLGLGVKGTPWETDQMEGNGDTDK